MTHIAANAPRQSGPVLKARVTEAASCELIGKVGQLYIV